MGKSGTAKLYAKGRTSRHSRGQGEKMKAHIILYGLLLGSLVGCFSSAKNSVDPAVTINPTQTPIIQSDNEPLPTFITWIEPDPQTARSIWIAEGQAKLCIRPDYPEIAEPGDYLASVDTTDARIHLFINGVEKMIMSQGGLLDLTVVQREGQTTTYPPFLIYCWHVADEPGNYDATVQIQQTSGNILLYSWILRVREDG